FIGGEQFFVGPAITPITPTPAGAQLDISLTLKAPSAPGTHSAIFRLRAPNGTFFGTNLTVVIVVPSPNTPTPTATLTPVPGAPNIPFFNCSPCTVISGA